MHGDVVIVEFRVPPPQAVLLQSILHGEDGLAMIRSFDPEKKRQQFWTTPEQLDDLYSWIESLPAAIEIEITGQWLWGEKSEGESDE